jgi:hypothetical protein
MENHPPRSISQFVRWGLLSAAALAAMLLASCPNGEEITTHRVPRPAQAPVEVPKHEVKVRLLAAIVPQDARAWFFKLVGPVDAVTAQEKTFDEFIRTIRLSDDAKKPITWKLPEGWREEPGKGMRYATLRLGTADAPLELSVLDASGTLLANVNRWRDMDVGLPHLPESRLGTVTRQLKTEDGDTVYRVDMSGPGGKGGMMKPPFAP